MALGQHAYPSVSAAGGQWMALVEGLPVTPEWHGWHWLRAYPSHLRATDGTCLRTKHLSQSNPPFCLC